MSSALATLFAGVVLDGRDPEHALILLIDDSQPVVRVRDMPARHHIAMVDLFDLGREADLIARCVQRLENEAWLPVEPEWVDALTPESHRRLAELGEKVNFDHVIATAQRQITRAEGMREMKTRMAETMCAPMLSVMRTEFGSWTSSLTAALSAAAAEKPSSTSP